ncbi:MAG: hypothetical protein Q8P46_12095 [Hyphomicrobiales bacterium]|nr:hypothetical protein [Hyphomicrobiales bacterium]
MNAIPCSSFDFVPDGRLRTLPVARAGSERIESIHMSDRLPNEDDPTGRRPESSL